MRRVQVGDTASGGTASGSPVELSSCVPTVEEDSSPSMPPVVSTVPEPVASDADAEVTPPPEDVEKDSEPSEPLPRGMPG